MEASEIEAPGQEPGARYNPQRPSPRDLLPAKLHLLRPQSLQMVPPPEDQDSKPQASEERSRSKPEHIQEVFFLEHS